jgi:hypothetical protein
MRTALRIAAVFALITSLTACSGGMGMMSQDQAYKIMEGMNQEEVVNIAGRPVEINRTRVAGMMQEQWVYDTPGSMAGTSYKRIYVYFENGLVSVIQH